MKGVKENRETGKKKMSIIIIHLLFFFVLLPLYFGIQVLLKVEREKAFVLSLSLVLHETTMFRE